MSEEKIYQRINEIDEKHSRRADELRSEMNLMVQSFQGHISDMTTSAAVISERFRQLKEQVVSIPKPAERPCDDFKEHLKKHHENETMWKRPIVSGVVGAVFASIVLFSKAIWCWMKANI